jgi:hypothetical protein
MRDANQSRFSAAGELNLGYLNPAGTSVSGRLGAEYSERNIFGMFDEAINKDLIFSAGADVELNKNLTVFAKASQGVNLLAEQALNFSPEVTVGLKLSL